jgi:phospholipid/cholesterol/gamma-HCH transport system substrate-binding protein
VSTTSPPNPPLSPSPPPGPRRPGEPPTVGRPPGNRTARIVGAGAVVLVLALLALILFGGGSGATYHLEFESADQLIRGNQVQVGGVPVGTINEITLTHDYKALVTIHVNSPLAPLHEGTTAQIRVPSLSSVASRYIALSPGANSNPTLPEGATLRGEAVKGTTDIDQIFNTLNPRTLKGLQEVFQGGAESYAGVTHDVNVTAEYFAPALASANHFFEELTLDQHTFAEFLVQGAKTVTTIAARREQLTDLVEHGEIAFGALAAEQKNLQQGVQQLPVTLHQANRTLGELPPTLADLTKLVNVSKPNTKMLATLLARLRPLFVEATPVLHNLSLAVSRPGANNDLTEIFKAYPALAQTLAADLPGVLKGLEEGTTFFSHFRPYSPELTGFARTLGQSTAYYDANGHYVRASATVPTFTLGSGGSLVPSESVAQGLQNLRRGQLSRCPGAATQPATDGSSPFVDKGQLECNPAEVP